MKVWKKGKALVKLEKPQKDQRQVKHCPLVVEVLAKFCRG